MTRKKHMDVIRQVAFL